MQWNPLKEILKAGGPYATLKAIARDKPLQTLIKAKIQKTQLHIARQSKTGAFWTISFTLRGEELRAYEPLHISVDFEDPISLNADLGYKSAEQRAKYDVVDIPQGNRLMTLLMKGNEVYFNFLNTRGQETAAKFSLRGLSAALLWIDDQQNRLKSPRKIGIITTATTNPQNTPPSQFTSGNTRVSAPQKLPRAIAKLHFADGECEPLDKAPLVNFGFESAALDKNIKLFLVPCFAAAYNVVTRAYVMDARYKDKTQMLLFAEYSDELGWTGTNSLLNVDYDAKAKSLSAFAKARGLGDCGSTSLYQWQQYAFKMLEYRYWGKCDGTRLAEDWPLIYRSSNGKK